VLCGAEEAVCRVLMGDSQIVFVITNCNTVDAQFNELIGGGVSVKPEYPSLAKVYLEAHK
jgi:hypothetical protein